MRLVLAILLAQILAGCSYLKFWGNDEPVAEPQATTEVEDDPTVAIKPATAEELELKLAKLWARVDELEEESYRQKERIKVLEKGVMLGLVPEELKKEEPLPPKMPEKPVEPPKEAAPPPAAKEPAKPELTKEELEKYQSMLAQAHDSFRAGRYGRAIKEYAAIGEEFGPGVDGGMHKYWIARSWANLKEYGMAHQRYVEFLKEHPDSPWVPRAKLDMARLEVKQGLRETAIDRFRAIIQEYPYEDVAEMARMELTNLEETL